MIRVFLVGFLAAYFSLLGVRIYYPSVFSALMDDPATQVHYRQHKSILSKIPYIFHIYKEVDHDHKGVITKNTDKMWGDYTFVVTDANDQAILMDHQGEAVHSWDVSFGKKWGEITHRADYVPFQHIVPTRAFLAPEMNGDIYVTYNGFGDPLEHHYGMIKFDKDSNVLWRYNGSSHHDIAFLDDHRLIVFASHLVAPPHPLLPLMNSAKENVIHEDIVWIDTQNGKEIKRLDLFGAFVDTEFASMLEYFSDLSPTTQTYRGDVFHPNTITPIPDHLVGTLPFYQKNSVLLSFKNLSLLAILNLETEKIVWASYGAWRYQHSPVFRENGNIVLFDNHGSLGDGGLSRVLEVNPRTTAVEWDYRGTKENVFFSRHNGMVDLLPNGNILVTSSHSGRVFEVTGDKEVIWDYYVPERLSVDRKNRIPLIYSAKRYTKQDIKFLGE